MSDFDHAPAPADADTETWVDAEAEASAASVAEIYGALAPELLDEEAAAPVEPAVPPETIARQVVHVLLVAHNGERWLPRTLDAVSRSIVAPASVVAVDTGSTDRTAAILADAPIVDAVHTLPATSGFPQAVAAARAALPVEEHPRRDTASDTGSWLWILHDDSAPHPDALAHLLSAALEHDAAVVGPKVLDWDGRRQLVEMGLSITGSGRRSTGLEGEEYDQGQHDDRLDVLAVGTAGMLVRRDAFEALDGLDPAIEMFRDDVDFGWRARRAGYRVVVAPAAVVEHAAAATVGRRRPDATRRRPPLVDRRNAVYVLLANAGRWAFPLVLLRTIVGSLLRAIGFVVGKVPGLAADEVVAVAGALRPRRLIAGRRWRRTQPHVGSVRGLRPTVGTQMRNAVDNAAGLLAGTAGGQDLPMARRRAAAVAPMLTEPDEVPTFTDTWRSRLAASRGLLLVGATALVTLVAARNLLIGGQLSGGALLPAPDDAGDLWATYLATWHPVGLGSQIGAPAYLAVLSGLSIPVLGNAEVTVSVLLLACLPMAVATAWWSLRGVTESPLVRLWSAAAYGTVVLATGAVAAGRLGTCVAAVLAPSLVRAVVRALTPGAALRLAWSAGFVLAVTAAFAPVAWPIVVAAAAVGAAALSRWWGGLVRLVIVAVVPAVLLVPVVVEAWDRPELIVSEPGLTGSGAELSDPDLAPWSVALLAPGGPGSLAPGALVVLPLLALAVLVAARRRDLAGAGWALALSGVAAGIATSRVGVSSPLGDGSAAGWPGPAVVLAGGGLVLAVAAGLDAQRLRGRGRLPVAALLVLAVAGLAVPAAWGLVRGLGDPLERQARDLLPIYIAEEASGPDRVRTLVLRVSGEDQTRTIDYTLLRDRSPRLGDAEVDDPASDALLDPVVGDLVAGRGAASVGELAALAVRYVYAPPPADPEVVETLDGLAGLVRASAPDGGAVWRVEGTTARVRLLNDEESSTEPVGVVVPSGTVSVDAPIDTPGAQRVVLAEQAADGWTATLDGVTLTPTTHADGLLAFELPASTGQLLVAHADEERSWLLAAQGIGLVVVTILLVPSAAGRRDTVAGRAS